MRKYNENAMFVRRLFRITLHVLPPVGQPRKGWIPKKERKVTKDTLPYRLKSGSVVRSGC